MRKRIAIAGHSDEGLEMIPLLEANPDIDVCAVCTPNPAEAVRKLGALDPFIAERFGQHVTSSAAEVLRTAGLVAIIDADCPEPARAMLREAPGRGIQVVPPLIAKLLYAFGPIDASRKPELLATLREILDSYDLTVDRAALLDRILHIAVGSTGADRGSLMLWDETARELRAEVAIGIEREVVNKIRVRAGEGVAGRAFAEGRALRLSGQADAGEFVLTRERRDVAAAISAPLTHGDRVLGVLNLSHRTDPDAFDDEDVDFVAELARMDARIIARAEDYRRLVADSARLRAEGELRDRLGTRGTLIERVAAVERWVVEELGGRADCALHAPYAAVAGLAAVAREQGRPTILCDAHDDVCLCSAALPLSGVDGPIGVLSIEGELPDVGLSDVRARLEQVAAVVGKGLQDALREEHAERRTERAAQLAELSARMSTASGFNALQELIAEGALSLLGAQHAVLRDVDIDGEPIDPGTYAGDAEGDDRHSVLATELELARRACFLGTAIAEAEPRADLRGARVERIVVGNDTVATLSVLGRDGDAWSAPHFDAEDGEVLARLAEHARVAWLGADSRENTHTIDRFDAQTGMPNAIQLIDRVQEEIARSSAPGRSFALVHLTLPPDATAIEASALAIRSAVRDFDVVARTADRTFELLLPEPDGPPADAIASIARALRSTHDPDSTRKLDFGYALYPDEGQTVTELRDLAREPRIQSDV